MSKKADESTTEKPSARLLDHPALWRAGELAREPETVPSGFDVLDRHLPGKGLPRAGLCEIMLPTAGVGELRLLLPALKGLSRQNRWIAWVNPPFIPYAPALEAAGVDITKILLIHPKSHKDALWALERATRSGTCSAALAWLDESELKTKDTRRLQFAARQGGTLSCLFRPGKALEENSMAELRLSIQPDDATADAGKLSVSICKRRGGWPIADLGVSFDTGHRPQEIREQLSLWRKWRAPEAPAPIDRLDSIPHQHHPIREDAGRRITH
jgi:cell division inhibitor SulA/protein ImuA